MSERLMRFFRYFIILYGTGFILIGMLWDWINDSAPDMGLYQWVLLFSGMAIVIVGLVVGRRFLFPIFSVMTSYLIFEVVVTFISVYIVTISVGTAVYMFEESGKTMRFDPIRGFRLLTVPSRFARKTNGVIEFVGEMRGNNQGFADRDDFLAKRDTTGIKRLAVFGDSFTTAQFNKINWPDAVEVINRSHTPIQLLNFSIDGGGIANWWSILTHLVDQENYEIDGIIFAVTGGEFTSNWNNLRRGFFIADHQDTDLWMMGSVPSGDPEQFPKTRAEAYQYLQPRPNSYIVPTETFDRFIQGDYMPPSKKKLRPFFAENLIGYIKRVRHASRYVQTQKPSSDEVRLPDLIEPTTMPLIEDFKKYIDSHKVPVMVVHIPSRQSLLKQDYDIPEAVLYFGHLLGADFINGAEAFRHLSDNQIRDMFFPFDGHWNQNGSDRFAAYIAKKIAQWP